MAIFPGGPGSTGTRMLPFWIVFKLRTMEVVVTDGTITCKAPIKSSPSTNQNPTFYRPGQLPFLLPDQQCQSTEGNGLKISVHKNAKFQQSLYGIVEFNVPLDTKLVLVEF